MSTTADIGQVDVDRAVHVLRQTHQRTGELSEDRILKICSQLGLEGSGVAGASDLGGGDGGRETGALRA